MSNPAPNSWILIRSLVVLVTLGFGIGCNSVDDMPPHLGSQATGSPTMNSAVGESGCANGNVQECRVELPEHNGIKSCFHGLQLCREGAWSSCVDTATLDQMLAAQPPLPQ